MFVQKTYAYGYIRISSVQQAQKEGTSMEMQDKAIRKWAKQQDYVLVDVLRDDSVSGTLEAKNRPTMAKILIQLNKGDVFLTYTVSRFSRNFADFIHTVDEIHKKGAFFNSVKENYDTRSSSGKLHMNILSSVAAQQAEEISAYALETAELFRQTGRHNGRPPYGYIKRNQLPGSGLKEVPEQQQYIGLIKLLRSKRNTDGLKTSYNSIATQLNELNIPTPSIKAKRWNDKTVKNICNRDKVRVKGKSEYEAIYSKDDSIATQ